MKISRKTLQGDNSNAFLLPIYNSYHHVVVSFQTIAVGVMGIAHALWW